MSEHIELKKIEYLGAPDHKIVLDKLVRFVVLDNGEVLICGTRLEYPTIEYIDIGAKGCPITYPVLRDFAEDSCLDYEAVKRGWKKLPFAQ